LWLEGVSSEEVILLNKDEGWDDQNGMALRMAEEYSLERLAQDFGIALEELVRANPHLEDSGKVKAGENVFIPLAGEGEPGQTDSG
jgi:hypothetical protein